ncbi:unnamed protein product [Brassicogethes aeneus]|uniref:Uncharacterized protein n=1 Tax=Brassicogethes aeneus TaxID=1431903 RepID=A0A9P0FFU0_BRAAE|nr:unnamed protein product [Brassicogethes aeneus]
MFVAWSAAFYSKNSAILTIMPGEHLDENQQRFLLNLVDYFQKELQHGGPLLPLNCIQERVANAFGISIRTVSNCLKRTAAKAPLAEDPQSETPPSSSKMKRADRKATFPYTPRKKWKTTDLPDPIKMQIRNEIHDMYATGKHVTLATLNEQLKLRDIVHISKTSLNILLQDIGFAFKKEGNRLMLMEHSTGDVFREDMDNSKKCEKVG